MKVRVFLSVILWAWVLTVGAKNIETRFDGKKITNDVFWNTAEGMPLYSQGGGIFRYPDPDTGRLRYYWYGVRYAEAVCYREDPSVTYPACTFEAVTCYSSDNLINWYYEGDVLTREEVDRYGRAGWVGRMGVAYLEAWNQYVLVVQHDNRGFVCLVPYTERSLYLASAHYDGEDNRYAQYRRPDGFCR